MSIYLFLNLKPDAAQLLADFVFQLVALLEYF